MNALGPLTDHAAALLTGTGLDVDAALAVASGGTREGGGVCGEALAQGWACGDAVILPGDGGGES